MPPRRAAAQSAQPAPPEHPPCPIPHIQKLPEQLAVLRTSWKWAAFGQFFFTFNPIFNMDDVTLNAIEDDLYMGTNVVLPRIVQRLLWTLSYDRKSLSDVWQTVLRRQYAKRDPAANPIGPDPSLIARSRRDTAEPDASVGTSSPPPHRAHSFDHDKVDGAGGPAETAAANHHDAPQVGEKDNANSGPEAERSAEPFTSVKEEGTDRAEPVEEPKDWLQLPMLEKLDCLHLLTEWQFQNPTRIRQLMRSEGDGAEWRIEPIGYDVKKNAYWLIGADRLWIQRAIPRPPRQTPTLKRKRAAAPKAAKNNKRSSAKRPRVEPEPSKSRASTSRTPASRRRRDTSTASTPPAGGRGGTRAAKSQANLKLDAQAKELAELQRQAQLDASGRPRPLGTRVSSRLRGQDDDEEWQQVPDAWLNGDEDMDVDSGSDRRRSTANGRSTRSSARHAPAPERTPRSIAIANARAAASKRNAPESESEDENEGDSDDKNADADSDAVSELTELSDEEEEEQPEEPASDHPQEEEEVNHKVQIDEPKEPPIPEGFVEWETIAVTLDEWEHVGDPFAKATHYLEKALYKTLAKVIAPLVIEDLRVVQRQKQIEEAVVHRKRSSRIAVKESAKEEARMAAKREAEEIEKNSRARRHEARLAKEQEQGREARESAREQRRREREEREERARKELEEKEIAERLKAEEAERAPTSDDTPAKANGSTRSRSNRKRKVNNAAAPTSEVKLMPAPTGSRTPEWELDCEVCHRRGLNLDDGVPMMCCGSCSRWQHIACHDRIDLAAGRPKRDWNTVDFVCKRCRELAYARQQQQQQQQHQQPYYGASRPTYAPHQYAMGQPAAGYSAYQNGWGSGPGQPYAAPYAGSYANGHASGYGQPAYAAYQPAPYAATNGAYANGTSAAGASTLANGGYLGQAQPDAGKWSTHAPAPNTYTPAYAESSRYLHTQAQAPGTGYGV